MADPSFELREVLDSDFEPFFEFQNEESGRQMAAFVRADTADPVAYRAHFDRIRSDPTVRIRTVVVDGAVAGSVLSYETDGQPEVSYWLGERFWGRGFATAAVEGFLRTCDDRRPMLARVACDNLASLRVLEKCGFERLEKCRGYAEARGAEIEEWTLRLP